MPFFFIASGLTTNFFNCKTRTFVVQKAKKLLLPFIGYSFIVFLLQWYISDNTIEDHFVGLIKHGWLGIALWFVPVLYFSLLIAKIILRIQHRWCRLAFILLMSLISPVLSYYRTVLPWNMSVLPFAVIFVIVGNWIKTICRKIQSMGIVYFWGATLVTIVISYFWQLDMAWNIIMPVFPQIIGAFSGSLMIGMLSVFIEKKCGIISKCLQFIGKETFLIMAFSQIFMDYVLLIYNGDPIVRYTILTIMLASAILIKNLLKNKLFRK